MWQRLRLMASRLSVLMIFLVPLCFCLSVISQSLTTVVESKAKDQQQSSAQLQTTRLEADKPIVKTIASGQSQVFTIKASAGDLLSVVVEQRGIDVIVALLAPDGRKLSEVDSPNGAFGPEPLTALIESTGEHRIEVRTPAGNSAGSFEIRLQELRASTANDRSRVATMSEAQQAQDRALQVANKGPDSLRTALPLFERALGLWNQLGENYWQGLILFKIGQVYDFLDDKEQALKSYSQAAALQKAAQDQRGEASTLDARGEIHHQRGEEQKALEDFNQALPLRKVAHDVRGEGLTLLGLGRVNLSLGETAKALDFFNQALPLFESISDQNSQALALANIAKIYSQVGETLKSLDFYNRALSIFSSLGNRSGEAKTLVDLGTVYYLQGDKDKALDVFTRAAAFFHSVNDRRSEATAINNIGLVYSDFGDKEKALEFFMQALPLRRVARDPNGEATTLNNIGALYYSLGEGQKALENYNEALVLYRSTGNAPGEATTLNNIATLYDQLGDSPKALEFYNQALAIRRKSDDKNGQANTLNAIGVVYGNSAEKQKALQFINEALDLYRAAGDRSGEATTLGNLGSVYDRLGEKEKALEFMNQALALDRATGNRAGEAHILNNIGTLYFDAGEKRKALEVYSQALPIRRAVGDVRGESLTLINMMLLWNDFNRPMAIFFGKQAITLLQQLRANVIGLDKEQQKQFLKTNERSYRILAYMLIGQGRLPEAQQVLNLFKDQQFFDFNNSLAQTTPRVTLTPRESSLAAEYNQATQHIDLAGQKLKTLTRKVDEAKSNQAAATELQQAEGELKVASDQFLAVLKRAETEFAKPATEIDKVKEVADTQNLQSALRELTQQTGQKAVAVYTLLDRELEGAGDGVFCALVVTGETINVVTQDIKADAVNKKALQLWGLLQSDSYDPRPLAQQLYATVFKPIEALLPKDTNTILWSLDGNLRYLPMGTLYDGKQYLIERFNNVVFTRQDRERLLRPVSARWTGLGLGSSQSHTVEVLGDQVSFNALPGVTEELRLFRQNGSASGTIDGEVFADAKFTKSAMLDALKRRRPLVHISSHFSFRPGDEARSFLLLGDGRAMTLAEMKEYKDLFAGVELLTLSACNTAAQQPGASGREIDGFAELAQRLGAGSVMATLWPVADNSTPWLMRQFYQSRQSGEGLTKAEAFRRAQLALLNGTAQTQPLPAGQKGSSSAVSVVVGDDASRRDATTRAAVVYVSAKDAPTFKRDASKPFAHPYYWAPFILIGNWK